MCGFANPISFKKITDNNIRDVETFIKEKCLSILQNRLSDSFGGECDALVDEKQMTDHFGMYADADVRLFEFQAGDILLIKELVDHVNRIVDEKGLQHFRKRLGKEQKMAETKRIKKNTNTDENDLKCQLRQKVIAIFTAANRSNDSKFAVEEITDNFVKINSENKSRIYGDIVCIACQNECTTKSKPKRVFFNIDRNGNGCWVMSNFKKHLERTHHLIIENVRPKTVSSKLNGNDDVIEDENGSHKFAHNTDSNGNELDHIKTNDSSNDDSENVSVLITNDDALQSVESADEDTESMIFTQLSNQITGVMESVLKHQEPQEEINFVLGKAPLKITVAEIPKDHNCIFGALAHQLWKNKISSQCQKSATKKLRADVVEHILNPENFAMFRHHLKDHVYALKNSDEIKIMTDEQLTAECKLFVRYKLSQNNKTWGGAETLLAVSNIFSTNVVVFYEDGLCLKVKAAGKNYDRSIAIAYRFGLKKEVRNHYDSVCDANSDDLLAAARKMTKKN